MLKIPHDRSSSIVLQETLNDVGESSLIDTHQ